MNDQLASTSADQLGDLLGEYRRDPIFWRIFFPAVAASFGGIFGFVPTAPFVLPEIHLDMRLDLFLVVAILFFLFSLLMAGMGVYIAARTIGEGNWRIAVFSDGLLLVRDDCNKVMRWAEITGVGQTTLGFGEKGDSVIRKYRSYVIHL